MRVTANIMPHIAIIWFALDNSETVIYFLFCKDFYIINSDYYKITKDPDHFFECLSTKLKPIEEILNVWKNMPTD